MAEKNGPHRMLQSALEHGCLPGIFLAAALLASACSDPDVTRAGTLDDPSPPATLSGVFRPGKVAGIQFNSDFGAGTTGADGRFTCQTGQPIEFSIGSLRLGEAACASIVHPAHFAADGDLSSVSALNLTRLLMLLDADETPANGIEISPQMLALAESWNPIDLATVDFEAQLLQVLSDIASIDSRSVVSLPATADAFDFLDASLSCAYSGVFANSFNSGAFSALTDGALAISRDAGSTTDRFISQVRRNHPQSQFFVLAEGTMELGAFPVLISAEMNPTGRISAFFTSPDALGVQWENAVSQQTVDRNGGFGAVRIGPPEGDYRFSGTYASLGDGDVSTIRGFISISISGDRLEGEAFDFISSGLLTVEGTVGADGATAQVQFGHVDGTTTWTLVQDNSGAVTEIDGTWPGTTSSELNVTGCRLL